MPTVPGPHVPFRPCAMSSSTGRRSRAVASSALASRTRAPGTGRRVARSDSLSRAASVDPPYLRRTAHHPQPRTSCGTSAPPGLAPKRSGAPATARPAATMPRSAEVHDTHHRFAPACTTRSRKRARAARRFPRERLRSFCTTSRARPRRNSPTCPFAVPDVGGCAIRFRAR